MNQQQAGIMNKTTMGSFSKIPDMICRLGRPGEKLINHPEPNLENMQTAELFTKVNLRPNPFFTSITLEVTSGQNRQVIVRMSDNSGQIMKLFGWYLLKGTNVTTMNDLNSFENGAYLVDILDNGGDILFSAQLNKA